jgi:hypothetical protein
MDAPAIGVATACGSLSGIADQMEPKPAKTSLGKLPVVLRTR